MHFVIRVDGNSRIGMGHVTRCVALANELKRYGDVQFISKAMPVKIPFKVNEIPDDCDDIEATRALLREANADAIIVDHHELEQHYVDSVRAFADAAIVIDDLKRELRADAVINVNAFSLRMKYTNAGKAFLGPKYALVGRAWARESVRKDANKILVSMGGADVLNVTPRVVKALKGMEGVDVTVVIGPAFENEHEIEESIAGDERFAIVRTSNLQKLMLEHDIAICGGGTTLYELAATGTPAIIISQAENQLINAGELDGKTLLGLGMGDKIAQDSIRRAAESLLKDYKTRKKFSAAGKKLVDGKGAQRVAKIIISECRNRKLVLKPAAAADSPFVLRVRNEKATRMNSFSTAPVALREHKKWFAETLKSNERKLYVIFNNEKKAGYVRIDSGKEMHIALAGRFRNMGFGSRAIVLACAGKKGIIARIKAGNSASVRAFENAGFSVTGKNGVVTMAS